MRLTADHLRAAGLDEGFVAVDDAVASHLDGKVANVAVVSEPFAARGAFLDYAEEEFGAAVSRVSIDSLVDGELPEIPDTEVVLVDDCHHLYTREIGGFDSLERFLDRAATAETLFVTSWNRYAWRYLAATRGIDDAFPRTVRIPRLDADGIAALVGAAHDGPMPEFVTPGDAGLTGAVEIDRRSVSMPGLGTVSVPVPAVDTDLARTRNLPDGRSPAEHLTYRRLARLSEGDPGVALRLWDRSITEGRIDPDAITDVDESLLIDDDEAFVLEVVLTNESIHRDRIDGIAEGVRTDRAIGRLVQEGVVEVDDETAHIVPERLYSTVEHLRARQLLW